MGTRGHAHERANRGAGGSRRLRTGPGGGQGAAAGHGVRGPHAWSLPGFRAKGNRGVDMLVVLGQLGPPHASSPAAGFQFRQHPPAGAG